MAADRVEQVVLVDAGNTNTVFGVYRGETLCGNIRLSTDRRRTADELTSLLVPLFARLEIDPSATDAVVVSSVVPPLQDALTRLAEETFGTAPMFVDHTLPTGMPIEYDNPAEVGADRIVNAVAARERYGAPVVVVDFGTATTFDVVNREGAYVGGIITPGLTISAEALFAQASRLYRVDLRKPDRLVGGNTASAMQSGIYYGYVGQVDGILSRLHDELGGLRRVVATGGLAPLIAGGSRFIDDIDPMLTLSGLKLIHAYNQGR